MSYGETILFPPTHRLTGYRHGDQAAAYLEKEGGGSESQDDALLRHEFLRLPPLHMTKKTKPPAVPGSTAFVKVWDDMFMAFVKSFEEEYGVENLRNILTSATMIRNKEKDDWGLSFAGTEESLHKMCVMIIAYIAKSVFERNLKLGREIDVFDFVTHLTQQTAIGAKARLTKVAL